MSPARVTIAGADLELRELKTPVRSNAQFERRRHLRYPIIARAEYRVAGNREQTKTIDMSSRGVLLETDRSLPIGDAIQISIDWPALLEQRTPLRLVVSGRILRSNVLGTAVVIRRYDFRLRRTTAL